MAMRLLTVEELENYLKRCGCVTVTGWRDAGRIWRAPDGRHFNVPLPEEPCADGDNRNPIHRRYPDWMLDQIITAHALPAPVEGAAATIGRAAQASDG